MTRQSKLVKTKPSRVGHTRRSGTSGSPPPQVTFTSPPKGAWQEMLSAVMEIQPTGLHSDHSIRGLRCGPERFWEASRTYRVETRSDTTTTRPAVVVTTGAR